MDRKTARAGWALVALAAAGLAVSAVLLWLHQRLATPAGSFQPSFCTINETVNCDVVLSSRYAYLSGIPVALWGALDYVVVTGLVVVALRAARFTTRLRLAQLVLALTVWNAAFSLYMAWIAVFEIGAVCIMCTLLYLVSAAALPLAWMLYVGLRAERVQRGKQIAQLAQRNRLVTMAAAGVAVVVAGTAAFEMAVRGDPATLDELQRADPEFYRWYTTQPVRQVPADGGNSKGAADAPVTIVEFSDFQCGHCAKATRVLKEVLPRYSGQVRVIFRHYPLDRACNSALQGQVHELACAAAVAAECAAEQGRFWEYHDLLFANQSRFDAESLASYARGLRLDMTAFSQCIAGAEARAKVARDVEQGNRLGIESTPTLFLNGRTVRGSLDADLLRQAINIERAKPS